MDLLCRGFIPHKQISLPSTKSRVFLAVFGEAHFPKGPLKIFAEIFSRQIETGKRKGGSISRDLQDQR